MTNEERLAKARILKDELLVEVRALIGCYQYIGNDNVRVHGPNFRACQDIIAEHDRAMEGLE